MRLFVIFNPAAGRGRAARKINAVTSHLKMRGVTYELATSRGAADLTALAARYDSARFDRLVVCGGDGTLHHVVRGLPLETSVLGIIPSGSGDDLARVLGLPRDPTAACDVILDGMVRQIDVALANNIRYLGVAGLGFDSEVARYANEHAGLLRGSLIYLWAIVRVLPRFKPKRVTLRTGEAAAAHELMFAVVANSPQYGGGIRIAPTAQLGDGLLDMYMVERCSRLTLLETLPSAYRGKHVTSGFVRSARGSRFSFESETPLDVYADGEFITTTPVEFRLAHEKLRVTVPHASITSHA